MRVAAVDCGTNTIKLLVLEVGADGAGRELVRESRMIRLGQGVDATGRLAEEALARAFAAVDEYAALVRDAGVDRLRFCATSATRDAANAADFTAGVLARLGVAPEVLSGDEEAALAFAGAVGGLRTTVEDPVLVLDVGGGSTEVVLGRAGEVVAAHSMDVGSVRLSERRLAACLADPDRHATAAELAAVAADVDSALDAGLAADPRLDPAGAATLVGIAGTVTSIAAGVLDLPAYDAAAVDQAVLDVGAVRAQCARLAALTTRQRLALPWMHPGRADVLGAGAVVVDRVLARVGAPRLLVSEADILDGIARSLLAGPV